jgi:hypothetical protein
MESLFVRCCSAPQRSAFSRQKYFFYSFSNIFSLTFNTPPSVVDVPLDHKQLVKLLPAEARAKWFFVSIYINVTEILLDFYTIKEKHFFDKRNFFSEVWVRGALKTKMITKYYLTLTVILSLNLCGSYTVTPSAKSSSISGKSDCKVSSLLYFYAFNARSFINDGEFQWTL